MIISVYLYKRHTHAHVSGHRQWALPASKCNTRAAVALMNLTVDILEYASNCIAYTARGRARKIELSSIPLKPHVSRMHLAR